MAYVPRKITSRREKQMVSMTFGDVLGVDFRSEETGERRTPWSENMIRSSGGEWETHAGFREMGRVPDDAKVYGIYKFTYRENNQNKTKVLIHAGNKLYTWDTYPQTFTATQGLTQVYTGLAERIVKYAEFGGKLLIADGTQILTYDGNTVADLSVNAFIPQTWTGKDPSAANGKAYQQRNLLQPKFKEGFIGDGTATVYQLSEKPPFDADLVVAVYGGNTITEGSGLTFDRATGRVTFATAPPSPAVPGVENVWITAAKTITGHKQTITDCDEMMVFDNRVFLTGNPRRPNSIFWCGYNDCTYFGEIMYSDKAGSGNAPVRVLQQLASDSFVSIKAQAAQDGTYTVWEPKDTGEELTPKIYVGSQANGTIGAISKHANAVFVDDNVFLSAGGLSAISRSLNISAERNIEHRSTLVDSKLKQEDLQNAVCTQYDKRLYVLVPGGRCYVAQGTLRNTDVSPYMEYEWAYLTGIGVWDGQYPQYIDADGNTLNPPNADGTEGGTRDGGEPSGEMIGGVFRPAICIRTLGDRELYFGCEGGVCRFNFDMVKTDSATELTSSAYAYNGRAIGEFVDTSFSWFGISNRYKKLIRYYNDLYIASRAQSAVRVMFRTELTFIAGSKVLEFNGGYFDFQSIDFDDFTFNTLDNVSFPLRKLKAKKFRRLQVRIAGGGIYSALAFRAVVMEAEVKQTKLR
jgi:hypothetical protein